MDLSESQIKLLEFVNSTDSKDIAESLRVVFNMALFDNSNHICCKKKDDLFMLEKLIQLISKI